MFPSLYDTIEALPLLCYDSQLPIEEMKENRPYRNITDLLICRSVAVKEILSLCGADNSIFDGSASDYERFRALCTVMPQLVGNNTQRSIYEVLRRVFGVEISLSLYTCDELWEALNRVIEKAQLTPCDVIAALGLSSLNYRYSPLYALPDHSLNELSLRPLYDLGTEPEALVIDPRNPCQSFEAFSEMLDQRIIEYINAECPAVCLTLPNDFRFVRNSKRMEIDTFYRTLKEGNAPTSNELAALRTTICLHIAKMAKTKNLPLILTSEADEKEVIALYDYLAMNKIVPMTVLKTEKPYRRFVLHFSFRTEKGYPGVLPLNDDIRSLASWFPLGSAILPIGLARDVIELAEGHWRRRDLAAFLASFDNETSLDSLAEDIAFGNILNRFGM